MRDWQKSFKEWYASVGRKGDPLRFPNLTQDAFKAGWDQALQTAQVMQEPTEEMVCVGEDMLDAGASAREVFKAMIASAPSPDTKQGE